MKAQLITFDLDNTLWETDNVMARSHRATERWLTERVAAYGQLSKESQAQYFNHVLSSKPEISHDVSAIRIHTMHYTLMQIGLQESEAEALAREAFDVFIEHRNQVELYAGARELLADLGQHVTLGSITNGNADVKQTPLGRYFTFSVTAAEAGVMKPNPKIFRQALALAGVTDPSRAVHIGDSEEDDVTGAHHAQMKSIWLNLVDDASSSTATITVHSLENIPSALRSIYKAG